MFNFLKRKKNITQIAERQLKENKQVIESLRDYDEGKKVISTDNVADRLSNVQTSS
ncbi:hypothetical protein KTR10_00575 [Candidatus Kaiserbacteria bacterium]|nr:hypothetical protein [Candidatus Kaiserbacteria bacterium]